MGSLNSMISDGKVIVGAVYCNFLHFFSNHFHLTLSSMSSLLSHFIHSLLFLLQAESLVNRYRVLFPRLVGCVA